MKEKKTLSARLHLTLSLALSIVLILIACVTIYINRISDVEQVRYDNILHLQQSFIDMMSMERAMLSGGDQYSHLFTAGHDVMAVVEAEPKYLNLIYFKEREHVLTSLLTNIQENRQCYLDVQRTLSHLLAQLQVSYSRHIGRLQSALPRRGDTPIPDIARYSRTDNRQFNPELAIINAMAYVQSSLFDVFEIFNEVQTDGSTDERMNLFEPRMSKLSDAVNDLDAYTPDAPLTGLLVDEFRLADRRFRHAYTILQQNDGRNTLLKKKLADNQVQIANMLENGVSELKKTNQAFLFYRHTIQNLFVMALLGQALLLFLYRAKLSRAFSRTIVEATRIGDDLTYRIPKGHGIYQEFNTIFHTLNLLAGAADRQVRSLDRLQREMGHRVRERTAELVHLNTRLKKEIADRIRTDKTRRELEAQLVRSSKMEAVAAFAHGLAPLMNIKQSGKRGASVGQDLLTLGRRGVVDMEVVHFYALVKNYLEGDECNTLRENNPEIRFAINLEEIAGNVRGSAELLQKAIGNIIINGIEAMPEGGVLSISCRGIYVDTRLKRYEVVDEGEYVRFSVADTGFGIHGEAVERIFEPFFATKERGYSGTGLGMAIAYGTIKDHGGYVDIESSPGNGTIITLYLPLSRENGDEHPINVGWAALSGNNEHILIVDDIYEQRNIASTILQRLNYTVVTAASGEEAVAYVQQNDVDLVLLDMIMPSGMDGCDTFMALKAVLPDIKVIITSGYAEDDRVRLARNNGAGTYVKKPYSIEVIGKAIRQTLASA